MWRLQHIVEASSYLPYSIPISQNGFTYLFTSRETIRPLFQNFGLQLPAIFEQPFNFSTVVQPGDNLPGGVEPVGYRYGMKARPAQMGE